MKKLFPMLFMIGVAVSAQVLENDCLRVAFDVPGGTFQVQDKRCGKVWRQETPASIVFKGTAEWIIPVVPAAKELRIDHTMTAEAKDVRDDRDCSAVARLSRTADNTSILLSVQVTDDKLAFESDKAGLWNGDSVELWLGHRNFGFYCPDGRQTVVCWAQGELAGDCQSAISVRPDGWVLEARIGLQHMPDIMAALNNGERFPIAVGVNDADDRSGREGLIYAPRGYVHRQTGTYAAGVPFEGAGKKTVSVHAGFTGTDCQRLASNTMMVSGVWHRSETMTIPMSVTYSLDGAELGVEISLPEDVNLDGMLFPQPMTGDTGDVALVPADEGFMVQADDRSFRGYRNGNPSMPWIGFTNLQKGAGFMIIGETPDDMQIATGTSHGLVGITANWRTCLGRFAYSRRLLYVFTADGRHVALCKRYRRYAQEHGVLKTLAEKAKINPNFNLLKGIVDIYGDYGSGFFDKIHEAGVKGAIVHTGRCLEQANGYGYVTSVYDIYTDLHVPESPRAKWERNLYYKHPDDTIKMHNGQPMLGWDHEFDKDHRILFPSHVACSSRQLWNMKKKIPQHLIGKPYRARFLDCTTAAGLFECFDPAHRMTRTDDRRLRGEMFAYLQELNLIPGSERGRWWAIPWIGYMEGIQSTGNFKNTEIGGWPIDRKAYATDEYRRTTFSPAYKLPLFSLVFHDCVITTWWWGDHSHRIPEIWHLKDLMQILYGSTPQWFLTQNNKTFFYANFQRFIQGYRNVGEWQGAVAFAEMVNHTHLSDDLALQRTKFANGLSVTANLGGEPKQIPQGPVLPGYHYYLEGPDGMNTSLPLGQVLDPGVNWHPLKAEDIPLNLDFETADSVGWSAYQGMTLALEKNDVQQGKYALRLRGRNEDSWGVASGPGKGMKEGEQWTLEGWMKITSISQLDTNPCFKIEFSQQGKYVVNYFTNSYDTTKLGTWQKLSLKVTVPAGKGIDYGRICVEKRLKVPLDVEIIIDGLELRKE